MGGEDSDSVGSTAKESGVTEGSHIGIAPEDVEADCKDAVNQKFARQSLDERRREHGQQQQDRAEDHSGQGDLNERAT